jgi:hypothetical protein
MPVELSASNDRRRAEPDLNRGDFGFDQNRGPIMGEREKSQGLPPRLFLKWLLNPHILPEGCVATRFKMLAKASELKLQMI